MANYVTFGPEDNELTVNTDDIRTIRKYEYDAGYVQVEKRWFREDRVIEDTRHRAACIEITFKDGSLVEHFNRDLTAMELGHDALLDALECLNTTP